jgi:single-strand DNA-binding protein
MYQKILLVGNLGRDPEMRIAPSGKEVTSFSMATSEKWTGEDGKLNERTMWWRVSVWGKSGVACNEYLKKGSKVLVEGRVTGDPKTGNPRLWTGQDGQTRASFEVTANVVKFLSPKGEQADDNGHSGAHDEPDAVVDTGTEIAF